MAEVIVNIGANTQDANAQISQLNQSLGQTGAAAEVATQKNEELEATLKKQEATIKTIDGAINLLGGSVELLASSLVLTGAATEDQAKEFEAAALGAIAFADGTKRTFDGVKSLNEGLKDFGGFAGVAIKAFNALKAAAIANPLTAIAVAAGTVVTAFIAWKDATKEVDYGNEQLLATIKKETEAANQLRDATSKLAASAEVEAVKQRKLLSVIQDNTKSRKEQDTALKELKKTLPGIETLTLKEAQSTDTLNKLIEQQLELRIKQAKAAAVAQQLQAAFEKQIEAESRASELEGQAAIDRQNRIAQAERLAEGDVTLTQALNNKTAAEIAYDQALQDVNETTADTNQLIDNYKDILGEVTTEQSGFNTELGKTIEKLDKINLLTYGAATKKAQEEQSKRNKEIAEEIKSNLGIAELGQNVSDRFVQRQSTIVSVANTTAEGITDSYATAALEFQALLQETNGNLIEWFGGQQAQAVEGTLSTVANFTKTLADAQDDSTKEAFEKAKKYKIAEVVTSALQASFQAFGAAQQFGPVLGPILGAAQVATIAIASKKAIADIQSSQFGGGAPNISAPAGGGANIPQGSVSGTIIPRGLTIGTGAAAPIGAEPIRAYVLTGDVATGLNAEGQIRRRRTLGG